ncbi:MAG TPA: hypothetical protein PKC43_03430 [Phycisphaerales bacterium]|nr:hypothetical protein [Phycisphaerales bacterium]HMP36481.1 hypothetical protein [Phycisphaerales bacterium]
MLTSGSSALIALAVALGTPLSAAVAADRPPSAVAPQGGNGRTVYVLPIRGCLLEVVDASIRERVLSDIERADPALVVLEIETSGSMGCLDGPGGRTTAIEPDVHRGFNRLNDVRDFVAALRGVNSRGRPVVAWVRDGLGDSTLVALGAPRLFMAPDARLGELDHLTAWVSPGADEPFRKKVGSGVRAFVQGILGDREQAAGLVEAFLFPETLLSADLPDGGAPAATDAPRRAALRNDPDGALVIDACRDRTARLGAASAVAVGAALGIAADLEEVVELLGLGDLRRIDDGALLLAAIAADRERRDAEASKALVAAMLALTEQAGDDDARALGAAKASGHLLTVFAALEEDPVLARLWRRDRGIDARFVLRLLDRLAPTEVLEDADRGEEPSVER